MFIFSKCNHFYERNGGVRETLEEPAAKEVAKEAIKLAFCMISKIAYKILPY